MIHHNGEIHEEVTVKKIVLVLLFVILSCPARAQELFVNAGATRDAKTGTTAGQWSVTYRQAYAILIVFRSLSLREGKKS